MIASAQLPPICSFILSKKAFFVNAEFLKTLATSDNFEVVTMAMAWIFTAMIVISVVFGICNGTMDAVSAAALSGANDAVTLCISLLGVICLWSGVLEIMDQSGLSQKLAAVFRPFLRKIFPDAAGDPTTLSAISANISANLLGIGNAATPLGIQAAKRMARGTGGVASDSLCRFIVLNTASIQLIPATVAGVRAACGAAHPFDILPAVWLSSVLSVAAGLAAAFLFQHLWGRTA